MMTPGNAAATRAYQQIDNSSEVENASPHRLIQLMMERTLTKVAMARGHMDREAVAEKGKHIGDAINIITGLQASLNDKPDAKLARNFDALYDYMTRRLMEANLKNDPAILDEVTALMRELKEAWDAIADVVAEEAEATA